LLAIATKPGIIKIILYGVLEGSNGEPLSVLIYVNDLDSNISNAIGIKATFHPHETTILFTVRLIGFNFQYRQNQGNILPCFHKKTYLS